MWITLLLMVVSYLATKSSTGDTKKGLLTAGLVGAGSAYVTTQTEWGKGLNSSFNESLGLDPSWTGLKGGSGSATEQKPPTTGNGNTPTGSIGVNTPRSGSFFDSLPGWLAGGVTAGVTAVGLSKVPGWAWLAAGGVGIYLIAKD